MLVKRVSLNKPNIRPQLTRRASRYAPTSPRGASRIQSVIINHRFGPAKSGRLGAGRKRRAVARGGGYRPLISAPGSASERDSGGFIASYKRNLPSIFSLVPAITMYLRASACCWCCACCGCAIADTCCCPPALEPGGAATGSSPTATCCSPPPAEASGASCDRSPLCWLAAGVSLTATFWRMSTSSPGSVGQVM